MPELPEVETICRGLAPVLTGRKIVSVSIRARGLRQPFPRNLAALLTGARVMNISRRAKYILVYLDNGKILALHLGMSGRITIQPPHYQPVKHDHLLFRFAGGSVLALNDPRRFGALFLLDEAAWESHRAFSALGPEPLSNAFSGPVLARALKGRKTAIKTAIMDQRIVVGVGNIYASEALFIAGISPLRQAGAVQGARAEALVCALGKVLRAAIKAGGSTLRDYRRADGRQGLFQKAHAVYGREGQACPDCNCAIEKTKGIQKIMQGGRSTFYCPRKQK